MAGTSNVCAVCTSIIFIIIGNVICGSTWASNGGPMTPPFELGPIRPIRAPDSDRDYQDTFAALTAAQRWGGNHSSTSLSRGGPRRERYGQLHVMLMIIIMIIRMIS